ncbi:MAG: endonuclease/exonuclease/phosphatase family protein [Bdellovibrionales bacterium]|nr:endonuclease/exonuclease/phosphatase family protein [Bdellovibrionales bacterium]
MLTPTDSKILKKWPFNFLVFLLFLGVISCAHQTQQKNYNQTIKPNRFSVMNYNVENLFDTLPDPQREDYTYLPFATKQNKEHQIKCSQLSSRQGECLYRDWNETALHRKLKRLSEVILATNQGKGPDLLILEEVENIRVLRILNDEYLQKAGYSSVVLIEGPDTRGIDIGMLSRLPLTEPAKLHTIPYEPKNENDRVWMARSRGILQAQFQLPTNETLIAFGVHLPSQANPPYWREQALNFINKLKSQLPENQMIIVGGDFNISAEEDLKLGFLREKLSQSWLVSHQMGCSKCDGTHNYRGKWSFFDVLLFSPQFSSQLKSDSPFHWRLKPESIQVINATRYQTTPYNTPAHFDENKPYGVSDHYPIYAELELKENPAIAIR